ncbi:hypothetical protein LDENG_00142900, partial [Lucifuga dentata]
APSIFSKENPIGSFSFQALHRRTDTRDPQLKTGWTALCPPHPIPPQTTSSCLPLLLQEDRSS